MSDEKKMEFEFKDEKGNPYKCWIDYDEFMFSKIFRKKQIGFPLTENETKWLEEHKEIRFEES